MGGRIRQAVKRAFSIVLRPQPEFAELHNRKFEAVLNDYIIMLAISAFLAAGVSLLFSFGYALFLDFFKNVDVQYIRMLNYSAGSSVSLIFFYLFAGSFLMFILSLILRLFVRKMRYVSLFSVIFYSLTPLLLFSWLRIAIIGLIIWSAFLFIEGTAIHNKSSQISKESIQQRD
jgi:uncharacterized protein with PQ loop repeat